MKFYKLFVIAILLAFTTSCTLNKTDYEAEINRDVTEYFEFKEVASLRSSHYKLSIEALNGTFYKGYNEVRMKVIDTRTSKNIPNAQVTLLPLLTDFEGKSTSCPHRYELEYAADGDYYYGYSVFTSESNPMEIWNLHLSFVADNQTFSLEQSVPVREQVNKNLNMTSFEGSDGEQYFVALIAPQKPQVAENRLVAGIYKYNKPSDPSGAFPDPGQFSYSIADHYSLLLDPRMPEPSMGNHSSPNNQDLTQQNDGMYHGVVNYTMTGNWTLNFIMLNQNGEIIKGTKVPEDFTPGIEGVKSQLHIDILF